MSQNNPEKKNGDPQPSHQRREHPSTYFVQDRSNLDEMTRLQLQGELFTACMGGALPEQSNPPTFSTVLDVGCGTGDWLIATAKTYPTIKRLVGVDVSAKMIEYAKEQAKEQGVGDRIEFRTGDALRMLEFPKNAFDLVNQRFASSFLRKWDWPNLLREYQRVCRPKGVIRITEANFIAECSSPALSRLYDLACDAFYSAGHYFAPSSDTIIKELPGLLHQYSFIQHVQTRPYTLEFRPGTPEGERFVEDIRLIYRTMLPFFRKWTKVPDDYEEIYQQAISESQHPDFVVKCGLLTAWGTNSGRVFVPRD